MQTQQPDNQKNLLLAILLSMAVLLGWQFFYAGPKLKEEQERQRVTKEVATKPGQAAAPAAAPSTSDTPAGSVPSGTPAATTAPAVATLPGATALTREAALKLNPRVAIVTPTLKGSISLKGGRIDDLILTGYRETPDPKSPNIVLLSPFEHANSYFAEYGWLNPPGAQHKLPDGETLWRAEKAQSLAPGAPQTLVWENGQGTHIPAGTNNLVDATGAGDSFAGGFLAHYLEHGDAVAAARFATTISAWVIEHLGARPEPDAKLRAALQRA